MRFDTRNMTPQQIADANNRYLEQMPQPFTGQPKSPMQPQVQQPARQLSPVRQYLNAMQQYRQGGRQGVRPTYAQFKQPQLGQQLGGMPGQPMRPQVQQPGQAPMDVYRQFMATQGQGAFGGGQQPGQQLGGLPGMGGGGGMPPIGQPMDQQRQLGMVQSPEMQAYYAQDAANQALRTQMMQGLQGAGQGPSPNSGTPSYSTAGGAGTTPTGGFGNMMDRFQQVQQIVGQPLPNPVKPQISGAPVGQPMGVAGGVGTPPQPNQPPMPMKKGGFAAKPVWDKERPEDLNKPKSLSVKKKKAAKARAKAAGRPYPNLVDNMAAARKKGK